MKKNPVMPSMESVRIFREKLEQPAGVFGPFMITSDPAFVEAAGNAGYDFVLLDMEHGPTWSTYSHWSGFPAALISGLTVRWT